MLPRYTFEKIKFGTDKPTFDRAVKLYEAGKISRFESFEGGCRATVLGTSPYQVIVYERDYDEGRCNCYVGQQDILCKHMVAVALWAVKQGGPLKDAEVEYLAAPRASGKVGELTSVEVELVKQEITAATRKLKAYTGPSRTWFAYQARLSEGCALLTAVVSKLPASFQTAKIVVKLLLSLDRKLQRTVDDSDGTVGGFMEGAVDLLLEFVRLEPACLEAYFTLFDRETCFGWEAPLVRLLDERQQN